MVSEIRVYVEGGDRADSEIRRGFSEFLRDLKDQARSKGIRWYIVPGRGRETTFDLFNTAVAHHRNAFNIVDEGCWGQRSARATRRPEAC